MLIAGVLSAFHDLSTGLLVVGLFLIANSVGLYLWRARKLSCYASTQMLVATSGICGLLAVFLLQWGGTWTEIQSGGAVSPFATYGVIAATFGGLMLLFYLKFGRRRDRGSAD
jgi:hypothetical protein